MTEDHTAIAQVLAGARDAFRTLVDRHQQRVFNLSRQLLCDPIEAEDITQEVFVAAYLNLKTFDAQRATFATWLLTITRHRCCNALRSRHRRQHRECIEPSDVDGPEVAVLHREVWQQFDLALAALPLEQRTAFALAEIHELSHAEIARIEGCKIGTVKSRISRAKTRLRNSLHEYDTSSIHNP